MTQIDRTRRCASNGCNFHPIAGMDHCAACDQGDNAPDTDLIEGPPPKSEVALDVAPHEAQRVIQSYFDDGWDHYNTATYTGHSDGHTWFCLFFRKGTL